MTGAPPAPAVPGAAEVDLRALRERVHTALRSDVTAVSRLLMAWSGKADGLSMKNGRARIRCPVPAHRDLNPSCVVHASRGGRVLFACRGCGSIGDLVTAHQLIFHTDVEQAMRAVAGAFGAPPEPPRRGDTATDAVIDAASRVYRVPADKITAASRSRPHVDARQAAMYVLRTETGMSYPDIGHAFRRDHSTVVHAVRKVERMLGERDDVRRKVLAVRALAACGAD